MRTLIDTFTGKIFFVGQGGYKLLLSPGSEQYDLALAAVMKDSMLMEGFTTLKAAAQYMASVIGTTTYQRQCRISVHMQQRVRYLQTILTHRLHCRDWRPSCGVS